MSRIKSKKHVSYMNLRDIDLRKIVNESVNMFLLHKAFGFGCLCIEGLSQSSYYQEMWFKEGRGIGRGIWKLSVF